MQVFWVIVLAAMVNILLLLASAGFNGTGLLVLRLIPASIVGAILTGISLLPVCNIFHGMWWRLFVLLLTAVMAYGIRPASLGKILLFSLLHLSLGGLTSLRDQPVSQLLGAAGICLGGYLTTERKKMIPVEIPCDHGILKFTALYDTGNMLKDPITGRSVLVVDGNTAVKLTELSRLDLSDPLRTMTRRAGFQLIPVKTVSNHGFLLAKKLPNVKIGSWQGSVLVAFSCETFGKSYQALTGGI